jgi:hypothetical protein
VLHAKNSAYIFIKGVGDGGDGGGLRRSCPLLIDKKMKKRLNF